MKDVFVCGMKGGMLVMVLALLYMYGKQILFGMACLAALFAVIFWKKKHRKISIALIIPCVAVGIWLVSGNDSRSGSQY